MKVESDRLSPAPHVAVAEAGACVFTWAASCCLFIASLVPLGMWVWDLRNAFFSLTSNVCWPHRQRPLGLSSGLHCFSFHLPTHPLHGMQVPKPTFSDNHKPPPYALWFLDVSHLATIFCHSGGSFMSGALWRIVQFTAYTAMSTSQVLCLFSAQDSGLYCSLTRWEDAV